MKHPLRFACWVTVALAFGSHAQVSNPSPPEVRTFLEGPENCSILIGGPDRTSDGADGTYGAALIKALTALNEPSPSAIEIIRSACSSRLAQPEPSAKEVL